MEEETSSIENELEIEIEESPKSISAWKLPPEFWAIFYQVFILITIATTQVVFWYMCSYDHRHSLDTIGLLLIFYACDLLYIMDTIWRYYKIRTELVKPNLTLLERAQRHLPLVVDCISLFPLEVFVFLVINKYPGAVTAVEEILDQRLPDDSIGRAMADEAFMRLKSFHKTIALLKLNRLLRLYRIPAFYRSENKEQLRMNIFAIETVKLGICFVFFLLLLCHSIACIWFSMNCTGVLESKFPPNCSQLGKRFRSIYKYSHLNQTDPFIWYLGGLHWSVMSLRNAGDPVLVPASSSQMLYSILTQLIGFCVTVYILILTIHIATILDLKRSHFFHEARGARNFARIMELNTESNVVNFMDQSFNYMWKVSRGFTDTRMISLIPKSIQTGIAMEIFEPMIQKSEVLRKCFQKQHLEEMAMNVHFKHYFANSFLIRPNAVGACMYYVLRGSIDVLEFEEDNPTILFTMGVGSLVGEADAFIPRKRRFGIKTRLECDVLKLPNSALSKILKKEPEIMIKITQIFKERTDFGKDSNLKLKNADEKYIVVDEVEDSGDTVSNISGLDDVDYEKEKLRQLNKSATIHISPLAWLVHFKRDPSNLTKENKKSNKVKSLLEQCHRLPESLEKYKFIPIPPSPDHRWRYGIISKESYLVKLWHFIVFITALCYAYGLPICVMLNDPNKTRWIDNGVDIIYMLDLAFRLLVFYHPSEMHHDVPQRIDHIKKEFRNPAILISLLPVIPIHHVLRFGDYRNFLYVRLHLYFIRFITVHLYFRALEHDVRTPIIFLRMIKNTIYMSIYIAFFSCLFCSFGCIAYPNCEQVYGETWVSQYVSSLPNTTQHDLKEFYDAFYLSLYWCVSTMFGIGYTSDTLAMVQKKETTLFTCHLVFSFVVLTYFFANVGAAISGQEENETYYWNTKISLFQYLENELTAWKLVNQVTYYMDLQCILLPGIYFNKLGFLSVSHSMFNELLATVIAEALHKSYLFQGTSLHHLKYFCNVARIVILPPNTCLIQEGEIVRAMHVIRRGYANVYKNNTNILVDVLSTGQSFGELNLIYGQPSRVTIRSVTYVEVIYILAEDFENVLKNSCDSMAEEISEMRNKPEEFEWFQKHFLVTKTEWQELKYEEGEIPPQVINWFKANPELQPDKDPYLSVYRRHVWRRLIRYLLLPCTFVPTGYLVLFWDKVRSNLVLLQLILVPTILAYPYLKRDYMGIIYALDFFTVLDMYFRMHTAYYERHTKALVVHPFMTAKHYFFGPFFLDLYGSVLTYWLIDYALVQAEFDMGSHSTRLFAYFLRMNRLIGVIRYWNYKKNDIRQDLTGKKNWRIFVLLSLYIIIQTHILACVSIVLACPTNVAILEAQTGLCFNGTWISSGNPTQRMQANGEVITGLHIYLFAFYFTATTCVGCGFGDFKPSNRFEQNLTVVQLFAYMIVFTYVLCVVASSRCHSDYMFLKYQQSMKYLVGWLSRENVDLDLVNRILRHYDYHWMRIGGAWPHELWPFLFSSLRKDVMYDTYEDVFRLVPEFHSVPRVFMREILSLIQVRYYLNHEIVIRKGDVCEYIYIIGNGNIIVNLTMDTDDDDDTLQLTEGGILGSMDPTITHTFYESTAICWTNVDMYLIGRSEFLQVLQKYPYIASRFVVPNHRNRNAELHRLHSERDLTRGDTNVLTFTEFTTLKVSLRKELDEVVFAQKAEIEAHMNLAEDLPEGTKGFVSISKRYESLDVALDDYMIMIKEENKHKYDRQELFEDCVLPVSKKFLLLDAICFWAAVFSSGVTAFQFVFMRFEWALWIIGFITDAIFIAKMILRFFVTYYDEMGDMISHILEMEQNYMGTYDGFIMDFFTALPLELFTLIYTAVAVDTHDGKKQQTAFVFWACLRLNRLLRIHFVWKYISNMMKYGGITANLVYIKIKRLLIITTIMIHWIVIIFFISTVSFRSTAKKLCACNITGCESAESDNNSPTSWVETKKETGYRLCSPYIMTMYFIVNTFTTTGYGDIYPITPFEMIFICLLAISSKVYVGLALTDILSGLQFYVDKTYHISADAVLKLYHSYGITPYYIHRVKEYLNYAWQQNNGVITPELLHLSPEVHRLDICFEVYGHVLEKSYLFRRLPLQFYKYVCTQFRTVWILQGDCIIKQHEVDDKVYFIHRGVVQSCRENFDEYGKLVSKHEDYMLENSFGEVNGLTGSTKYQRTYTAKTNVDLVYLTHDDVKNIFAIFPKEQHTILGILADNYFSIIEDPILESNDEDDDSDGNDGGNTSSD